MVKANDKKKYNNRFVRELNNGAMELKKLRPSTIDKYKIEYDDKTKKHIFKL